LHTNNDMEKDKKKTLTISTNLKKRIDTSAISTGGKKTFSVSKKKPFKSNKPFSKTGLNLNFNQKQENQKKMRESGFFLIYLICLHQPIL